MNEARQQSAIDALRDWSKWLIGLDFAAATGCVVVLQTDVATELFLVLAISAFALSVVCSVLVVRALASLVETLPFQNEAGEVVSIYEYQVWGQLSLANLVALQMLFFVMGIALFLTWVV
jgi:hypothetical protein